MGVILTCVNKGERKMNKKTIVVMVLSMLVMLSIPVNLASAAITVPNPNKFTYLTTGGPETADPAWAYDTASGELIFNAIQTLCFFEFTTYDTYAPQISDWWPGIGVNLGNAITPLYPGQPAFEALNPHPPASTEETWLFHIRQGMPWQTYAYNPDTELYETYNYGNVTAFDVEYSIERGMLMDHTGGPQWMLFDPLTNHYSTYEWDLTDPVELAALGHIIDDAIQSNSTYVWFNLVKPYVPFQQILSQNWAAVIPHQYAIDKGCWDGGWHTHPGDYTSWINWHDPDAPGPLGYKMLGCGPYYLDYISADGSNHRLRKFDNYWGGWSGDYVDTIVHEISLDWAARKLRFFSNDPDTQADMVTVLRKDINDPDLVAQVNAGNVRYIKDLPTIQADCMLFSYNYTTSPLITPGNGIGTGTAGVYTTKTDLLSDRNMRLALIYAYNATQFIQQVMLGEAVPLHDCIVYGIPYCNDTKQTTILRDKNLALVVHYLKLAWGGSDPTPNDPYNGDEVPGEVWNKGFQVTIVHSPDVSQRRTPGTLIKNTIELELPSYLAEHGISRPAAGVDSVMQIGQDWGTFITNMYSGILPAYVVGWLADFPDPHDWVQPFMSLYGDYSHFQQVKYGQGVMDWSPLGSYGKGPNNGFPYKNYKGDTVTQVNNTYVEYGLIRTGIATPPGPVREQLYNELEDIYYAEAASIMTMQPRARHYERQWVHGWIYNAILPGLYFYGRAAGVGDYSQILFKKDPATVNRDVAVKGPYYEVGSSWYKIITVYNLGDNPEHVDIYEKIWVNGILIDDEKIVIWLKPHQWIKIKKGPFPDGIIHIETHVEISDWTLPIVESDTTNNGPISEHKSIVYGDIGGTLDLGKVTWGAFDLVCDYQDANLIAKAYKVRNVPHLPLSLADFGDGTKIENWDHPDGICDFKDVQLFSRAYKARTSQVPV